MYSATEAFLVMLDEDCNTPLFAKLLAKEQLKPLKRR